MNAVWMLCLSNLRKKKVQNGLIALLILLSTLLLATSATVIANTENVFTDIHDKSNGAHQLLELSGELHDPLKVNHWWKEQEGVAASDLIPYRNLSGVTYDGKEIPNLYLLMMNTPEQPSIVDQPILAQGEAGLQPKSGFVWIPTSMAYTYGISIGDSVTFKTGVNAFESKVSAIVVDIPYGGPFTVNARIWMNSEDYDSQLGSMQGKDKYLMSLRFDDYNEQIGYWNHFEEYLGVPYMESKTEFESISSFYLILNKVIGFVMIFLGVVMMHIALFTIGFTISDAILSNYKTIGIIKSLGLTSNQTIGTYMIQYAFLAIIAIIPGLLASSFLSRIIIESSLSYLKTGDSAIPIRGGSIVVIVGISLFLIILLCVWFYSNKARSVQPVQAIRYGMSEEDNSKLTRRIGSNRSNRLGFERLPVTFVIGLRAILKNIKGSSLMMVLAIVTSSVLVLGFVLLNSFIMIKQTSPLWGYDDSNIAVTIFNKTAFSHADFEKDVLSDQRVKNIGWVGGVNGVFPSVKPAGSNNKSEQSTNIAITVIDGNYDELGYAVIRGDNPQNNNEIALGVNLAKQLNKELGDIVEVYIGGNKHNLIVTGIYQAIANMSFTARMTVDAVKENHAVYEGMEIMFINLKDNQLSDQFAQELNTKYKESIAALTQQTLLDSVFKEAVAVLMWPMAMMGLLFLFVTFIIIYSTCLINIKKESKTYGIYKSIGMTSFKIRISVTLGIAVLSAIGAIIGIFAGVYLLPAILKGLISDYGIVKLPLVLSWSGIAAIAFISVLSACFGSWLSSRVIDRTSPRILVVE